MFLVKRHGFLFVRVGRDYLLFYGPGPITVAGTLPKKELMRAACAIWHGSVDWEMFADVIRDLDPNKEY
jgi:hypothetical protein